MGVVDGAYPTVHLAGLCSVFLFWVSLDTLRILEGVLGDSITPRGDLATFPRIRIRPPYESQVMILHEYLHIKSEHARGGLKLVLPRTCVGKNMEWEIVVHE